MLSDKKPTVGWMNEEVIYDIDPFTSNYHLNSLETHSDDIIQ
jgi:hypothetical protein